MLHFKSKSVSKPKSGNTDEENEDNILEPVESGKILKLAISDGATESSFSKEWSSLLVNGFNTEPFTKDNFTQSINRISEEWLAKTSSVDLPWYAQQKAELGSFATFLGLTVNLQKKEIEAIAVGDCTLFLIRKDKLAFSFPIQSYEQFGNTPTLISSNEKYRTDLSSMIEHKRDKVKSKDVLLIATDAIAAWIFKELEAEHEPWTLLSNFYNEDFKNFDEWLSSVRGSGEMKNDDVTLMIVKFD